MGILRRKGCQNTVLIGYAFMNVRKNLKLKLLKKIY